MSHFIVCGPRAADRSRAAAALQSRACSCGDAPLRHAHSSAISRNSTCFRMPPHEHTSRSGSRAAASAPRAERASSDAAKDWRPAFVDRLASSCSMTCDSASPTVRFTSVRTRRGVAAHPCSRWTRIVRARARPECARAANFDSSEPVQMAPLIGSSRTLEGDGAQRIVVVDRLDQPDGGYCDSLRTTPRCRRGAEEPRRHDLREP